MPTSAAPSFSLATARMLLPMSVSVSSAPRASATASATAKATTRGTDSSVNPMSMEEKA